MKTSFSRKIMVIFFICSAMIIFLSSIVCYLGTVRLLQNQYIDSTGQLLAEVNQSIERYYSQLNEITLSFYNSSTFIDNLRLHRDDYISQAENEQTIKNVLYSDDSILYIYFYDPYSTNLYSFSRENMSYTKFPEIEKEDWYQDTLNAHRYFTISPLHSFINYTNFGSLRDATVFSVNRALRYYANSSYVGMVSIVYRTDALERICGSLDGEQTWLAVLDQNLSPRLNTYPEQTLPEEVLHAISENANPSGYTIYHAEHEQRLLLWNQSDDIYLLKDIPYRELTRGIVQNVIQMILILAAVFLALATGMAYCFSRTVTRRLNALTAKVVAFGEGELSMIAEDYGEDEIGTLASAFNEMTAKINELINLEYKAKLLQKTAELQMLQAQVKPHFINNTLQAMGTLGLKKGANDVYLMANALARTLRYTLRSTARLIPLSKELENMNDYLYIQRILWGEQLHTSIQVEDGVKDWPVPVLILQPLVENSIKHGLDSSPEGSIYVVIQKTDEKLSVTVSDDGRGIPPATLKMLQEWLLLKETVNHAEEHMGILNIVNRMQLIYGEEASMTIDSKLDEGTAIRILLPRKEITDV
ncbi:MAG: histidine kinase [Lachnospiraceae bacterium]